MELIKKNIHMDRLKSKAATQIALEDDVNISDNKPDAAELILNRGEVKIEEIKTTEDHVGVKGKLCFAVMYLSDEGEKRFYCMEGKLPFDEMIYAEGIENGDTVNISADMEDLTIGMINSRKLSVQALLNLTAAAEELYDEETAVEVHCEAPVECRKKTIHVSETAVRTKDIFRFKEEIEIPQNLPNIFQLVWNSIRPGSVEFKLMDDKISIQGELGVFLLYEGEDAKSRWYETTLPFAGAIECHGCSETMIPDIRYEMEHRELEVRPDFDGEERIVGLDMAMNLDIKLYEEEKTDILSDVYGVTKEITAVARDGMYRNVLVRSCGRHKASEKMKVKSGAPRILQLCHSEGNARIEKTEMTENGILLLGMVNVQILYITSDDAIPFASLTGSVPFRCTMEAPGIHEACTYDISASLEQLQTAMSDSEEIDVKAVVGFNGIVFDNQKERLITDIEISELDLEQLNELPGVVGYIAKEGDTLWQIGRQYYVPIDSLREMNGLNGDELKAGDKLLIVK